MDAIAPILHAAVTKIALIFRPPSPRLMLPHAEVLIPTATLKDIGLEDLCPVESLSTWTSTTTLPSIAPSSFSTKLILVALFTSLTIFALGLGALFILFRLYALAARAHQRQINSLKEQLAAKDTLIANKDTLLADKDTQLATRDAQITSQSDDLTAKAYQLFAKDVAAAALRQQIVALEADATAHRKRIAQQNTTIVVMKRACLCHDDTISALRKQCKEAENTIERSQETINEIRSTEQSLRTELQAEKDALKSEKDAHALNQITLVATKQHLTQATSALKQMKEIRSTNVTLTEELSEIRKELDTLKFRPLRSTSVGTDPIVVTVNPIATPATSVTSAEKQAETDSGVVHWDMENRGLSSSMWAPKVSATGKHPETGFNTSKRDTEDRSLYASMWAPKPGDDRRPVAPLPRGRVRPKDAPSYRPEVAQNAAKFVHASIQSHDDTASSEDFESSISPASSTNSPQRVRPTYSFAGIKNHLPKAPAAPESPVSE